nr:MAG: hypothetical protein DIU70_10095 [Bacillota bacterium]
MRQQMTGFQLGCLMALYSQVAQLLFLPAVMAELAGRDAWLAVLAGGVGGLPVVMATWAVASRYPGISLAQAARYLLGKWAGGLVGILCWAFFLFLCSLVVRNLMDSIGMAILPGTPHLVIGGLILGLAVYAIYDGVEVLGHLSGFLAVSYIAAISAVFLLLVDEIRLGHLLPVLLPGPGPVLRAAWPSGGLARRSFSASSSRICRTRPGTVAGLSTGTAWPLRSWPWWHPCAPPSSARNSPPG